MKSMQNFEKYAQLYEHNTRNSEVAKSESRYSKWQLSQTVHVIRKTWFFGNKKGKIRHSNILEIQLCSGF